MSTRLRIASAVSMTLLVLVAGGSPLASAAPSSPAMPAQINRIAQEMAQQAAAQARIAASRARQAGGTLSVPLPRRQPIVVTHTVESFSLAVYGRASTMLERHLGGAPVEYARFVVRRACLHKEMAERLGEEDAVQATYNAISDLPGNAALLMRIVALANDMSEADSPSDAVGMGAAAFVCEVA